jgi:hypothetical protein
MADLTTGQHKTHFVGDDDDDEQSSFDMSEL